MRINFIKKPEIYLQFPRQLYITLSICYSYQNAIRFNGYVYFLLSTLFISSRNIPVFFISFFLIDFSQIATLFPNYCFLRDNFLRLPFPCRDAEIQCQVREVCDAKYRIQKALHGNICGNTRTDRSQPFKMKFNTHHLRTLRLHALLVPLISYAVQRRVLAKCFMQFYGKPGIYLSMRNQPSHFSLLRDPDGSLQNFYKPFYSTRSLSGACGKTYNVT